MMKLKVKVILTFDLPPPRTSAPTYTSRLYLPIPLLLSQL